MAHTKYRISVPLSDETAKAIEFYAEVSGSSRGAACGHFLDELAPHIHGIADALAAVKKNPRDAVRKMQKLADEAQRQLREEQTEMWDSLPSKGK